jgi:hypothetical protein
MLASWTQGDLASWTQGDIVRIGIANERRNGYLVIGNQKWRSLEEGKNYKLKFQFDAETPWTAGSAAIKLGPGATALLVVFSDVRFFQEFASKNTLVVSYDDTIVTRLPLTRSLAAMRSVAQCQDKVDLVVAGQTDPFSKRDTQSDPFSKRQGQPPLNLKKPDDPFSGSRGRSANGMDL